MFNFLKGSKANVQVTLDPSRCRPGDTIRAQVAVSSDKDLAIREGRVALVVKEEHQYRYEERRRDSDGHWHTDQRTSWQTAEHEVARTVILPEGNVPGGSPQTYECAFTVPPDASLSGQGQLIRVHWTVKATLDRKMAGDVEGKADVQVYTPPPGPSAAGQFGYSNEPGEAALSLALPGREFALGETIEGQLLVHPQKAFGVSEVRVELVCLERMPSGAGTGQGAVTFNINIPSRRVLANEAQQVVKAQVAGKTKLEAGQQVAYPFRLTIPATGLPSGHYHDGSVDWLLKGILARSLRADTQVDAEILVFGGRP